MLGGLALREPAPEQLSEDSFVFLKKIGQGTAGSVYKCQRKSDRLICTIKQIDITVLSEEEQMRAINEVRILASLENPYIVRYFDSFLDGNYLNIVMEYIQNGTLNDRLKNQRGRRLGERAVWRYFLQVTAGVHHIHSLNVLHRDLKTLNILLDSRDEAKIVDLGVSKKLDAKSAFAHTVVGTPYYLSPELCEDAPYNKKSDVWAMGCVLYELCTLKYPFQASNQAALVLKILQGDYAPISCTYSRELETLLSDCLNRDPERRPNTMDILASPYVISKARSLHVKLPSDVLLVAQQREAASAALGAPAPRLRAARGSVAAGDPSGATAMDMDDDDGEGGEAAWKLAPREGGPRRRRTSKSAPLSKWGWDAKKDFVSLDDEQLQNNRQRVVVRQTRSSATSGGVGEGGVAGPSAGRRSPRRRPSCLRGLEARIASTQGAQGSGEGNGGSRDRGLQPVVGRHMAPVHDDMSDYPESADVYGPPRAGRRHDPTPGEGYEPSTSVAAAAPRGSPPRAARARAASPMRHRAGGAGGADPELHPPKERARRRMLPDLFVPGIDPPPKPHLGASPPDNGGQGHGSTGSSGGSGRLEPSFDYNPSPRAREGRRGGLIGDATGAAGSTSADPYRRMAVNVHGHDVAAHSPRSFYGGAVVGSSPTFHPPRSHSVMDHQPRPGRGLENRAASQVFPRGGQVFPRGGRIGFELQGSDNHRGGGSDGRRGSGGGVVPVPAAMDVDQVDHLRSDSLYDSDELPNAMSELVVNLGHRAEDIYQVTSPSQEMAACRPMPYELREPSFGQWEPLSPRGVVL